MKIIFIEYPKCSTCQKAKKWLESNNIEFEDRHIVEETPTIKELQKWIPTSNKEIKNWFNTSGLKYKSLNLKEKLQTMTEEEKIETMEGIIDRQGLKMLASALKDLNEIIGDNKETNKETLNKLDEVLKGLGGVV